MRVTKLQQPELLVKQLEFALTKFGIELYDINYPTRTSVSFRAKRQFNKPYYGGGTKFGAPCYNSNYYTPSAKNAKHLHWEEWAILNDLINDICDCYELGGSCQSYFDGEKQYIRRDGNKQWTSPLDQHDIDSLIQCAIESLGENAIFPKLQLVSA